MRLGPLLAMLLAGCTAPNPFYASSDGGEPARDLAAPVDEAVAPADLVPTPRDQGGPPDMATVPPDLARPDLAGRRDLYCACDLSLTRDLAAPVDQGSVPDQAVPDLAPGADLSSSPDLTVASDATVTPPDLTVSPDLVSKPIIQCGPINCSVPKETCCTASYGTLDGICSSSSSGSCPVHLQVPFSCDGPEDCGSAATCCYIPGQGSRCNWACKGMNSPMCHIDADCVGGTRCCALKTALGVESRFRGCMTSCP